jgi:hypothetical protein
MKPRKPTPKPPRRKGAPHPLEAQLLLYREAVRRIRQRTGPRPTAELPIDDEMLSES